MIICLLNLPNDTACGFCSLKFALDSWLMPSKYIHQVKLAHKNPYPKRSTTTTEYYYSSSSSSPLSSSIPSAASTLNVGA